MLCYIINKISPACVTDFFLKKSGDLIKILNQIFEYDTFFVLYQRLNILNYICAVHILASERRLS